VQGRNINVGVVFAIGWLSCTLDISMNWPAIVELEMKLADCQSHTANMKRKFCNLPLIADRE
jgi:hypothetical protein